MIAARAPHEGASPSDKDACWAQLATVSTAVFRPDATALDFVLIDANARAGDCQSEVFGSSQPEPTNDNGLRLIAYLEQVGMVAVNSFHPAGPTWASHASASKQSRIDYVLARPPLTALVSSCEAVSDGSMILSESVDHFPLRIRFDPIAKGGDTKSRFIYALPYNRSACKDPWKRAQFEDAVWAFNPSKVCDPSTHLNELNSFIVRTATAVFGKVRDAPRKPWISEQSWSIIKYVAPCEGSSRPTLAVLTAHSSPTRSLLGHRAFTQRGYLASAPLAFPLWAGARWPERASCTLRATFATWAFALHGLRFVDYAPLPMPSSPATAFTTSRASLAPLKSLPNEGTSAVRTSSCVSSLANTSPRATPSC